MEDENADVAVPTPSYGAAEPARADPETSAGDHFLYVPDASQETGWTTYRIRRSGRSSDPGRRIGFRR
jgi:hypothetical protein